MFHSVALEPQRKTSPLFPEERLYLVGCRVGVDARNAVRADIEIGEGRIQNIFIHPENNSHARAQDLGPSIDLGGYLILPGLINAHDHLEFNLFPRLGHGPYSNYQEWAKDIFRPGESPLREILAVPERVRLWWGGLKNLLAGVTTVCHHNPYIPEVFENDFPVHVVKRFKWSHSLAFGNNLEEGSFSDSCDIPFIIHLGEGTDARSRDEVFHLHRRGALHSRTVIVHGVALGTAGLALLEECDASLVWCPTSNYFTVGKTLDSGAVKKFRRIALGSDSSLTAQGDLLDEIRFAYGKENVCAERVYAMVSGLAADLLRLTDGEGTISIGKAADLLAIKDTGKSPAEALVVARPGQIELVLKDGRPNLLSPMFAQRWLAAHLQGLESLTVDGVTRLVRAPVRCLFEETAKHLGSRFKLAGKEVYW